MSKVVWAGDVALSYARILGCHIVRMQSNKRALDLYHGLVMANCPQPVLKFLFLCTREPLHVRMHALRRQL